MRLGGAVNQIVLTAFAVRYAKAWSGQRAVDVAGFFSDTGSLTVNSNPPAIGRAAIAQVAQGFMTAFPDMQVVMDDLVIEPDRSIFKWTLAGTNNGPGGTGKRVRISGQEAWQIADGLISESIGHFDAVEYVRQLKFGDGSIDG